MKIFLSGEVQTNWRDEITKMFKEHEFYNPKVKNYSAKDKKNERKAIKESDLVIIRLKDAGKGTKNEMKYCASMHKPTIIQKDNANIIHALNELK